MQNIAQIVRKYPFSLLCILLIWILSLAPFFPETPLDDVAFIDKWTHLVMYGGTCGVIWWEYLRCHRVPNRRKLFLFAWLSPIVMSGLLELIQEYGTATRSGEWTDLMANSLGATIAAVLGLLYLKSSQGV